MKHTAKAALVAALLAASCGGGGGDPGTVVLGPLTLTLTAPADLADNVSGMIAITASTNVAAAGVEFQIDGQSIGGEDTNPPYSVSLDTSAYASGQHVVRARARSVQGARTEWASATVRLGGSRSAPASVARNESWVTGLQSATAFARAPDGRFFVAEQGGSLRVVKNGALLPTPFVTRTVDSAGERGLLGVALHPQFAANGWVYVYYTRVNGGLRNNRIARFTANGDVAAGGEDVVVDLPNLTSATNHNGGAMKFGTDGRLYVAVGDNNNTALPQNLASPLGKLLRFADDLSIPTDNPFYASQTGLARAVWAYGLRNPFTFAVQPVTGRIHVNDVGQNTWEEINLGAAGANFGWPASEGPDNVGSGVTGPLFAYRHTAASPAGAGPGGFFTGQAITGGTFHPGGGSLPASVQGNYFFADFVSRFIGVLDIANGNTAFAFGRVSDNPVDLLVGADGALYVLGRSSITRFSGP